LRLEQLFTEHGQSPWLDNLNRGYLRDGTLTGWEPRGVRGVTADPTILAKAIKALATTTSNSKVSSPKDAHRSTPTESSSSTTSRRR
jgi:hypothetical protein